MHPRSDEPDALTEAAFDRELKAALDVDPSPEFLARVRTRLASEPEPSAWGFPWLFAAAGAVAIVVAAVVVPSRLDEPREADVLQASSPAVSEAVVGRTFRSAPSDSVVVKTFRSAIADSSHPEVLIWPDEVRGLRRLIAMASEEDVNLEPLLAGPTILATVGPDGEITIPPITIDPLVSDIDSDTY